MSAPPAPTWSPPPPPSGGAMSSEPDDSPSDGSSSLSVPPVPGRRNSSISSSSTTPTPPPHPPPPARGGGASAPQPTPPAPGCAACKHKRQKCTPGCVLAPYFPASDPDKFRSVLRVFGVKNLLRTLREVPRPRWDACVRGVVFESRMRLADPVRGCSGAIEDLEAQLLDTAVELEVLRRRLESYRLAKSRGLRFLRPPNPRHGGAAASPRGVTDLDAVARQQSMGIWAGDDVMQMQPQGPYGAAWPPAMAAGLAATPLQFYAMPQPQGPHGGACPTGTAELAAPPPQFYAMQSQGPHGGAWRTGTDELAATPTRFHVMQPQFSAMPPQLPVTQPPQFPAMQPQPAMRRRRTAATRGATATIRGDFGDAWADNNERGDDPDDM